MANIDDLKYNFDQGARANRYEAQFFLPELFGGGKDAGRNMGLRVESCELPGRSVDTTAFHEYGADRLMPNGAVDDGGSMDMTFICTQDFADRLVLEAWNQLIFTAEGTTGDKKIGTQAKPKFRFYDEYTGKIAIHQLRSDHKGGDDTKRIALKYEFAEAYPISFDSMSLGYGTTDILRFNVSFAYRWWSSEYVPAPERSFLNKGRVLLDSLLDGSNLLSRFGKEGKVRKTLTNLATRTSQIQNIFGGG